MKTSIQIIILVLCLSYFILQTSAQNADTLIVSDTIESLSVYSVHSIDSLSLKPNHPNHKKHMEEKASEVASNVVCKVFRPDSQLKADSIIKVFDDSPSFGIYKDNYIVLGTDLFKHPDPDNSDAKFQISVMQRLTNSVLPLRTYLFLTYTQLAFWDVFQESFPFRDINFNPTLGLGKPLVMNNRYLGDISLQLEHESNGKDGDASRSWNKISFSGVFNINRHWTYFSKLWIPFVDGENNRDIVQYKGYGTFAINYNQRNKYSLSFIVTPRTGGFGNINMTFNASYRLFKEDNQYLFFEFYNGYGEGMLDYKEFHQRFRIGFVIKPTFRFIY